MFSLVVILAFCVLLGPYSVLGIGNCTAGPHNDVLFKRDLQCRGRYNIIATNMPGWKCFKAVAIANDEDTGVGMLSNGTNVMYITDFQGDRQGHYSSKVNNETVNWTFYKNTEDGVMGVCAYTCDQDMGIDVVDQLMCAVLEDCKKKTGLKVVKNIVKKITESGLKISGTYDENAYPEECNLRK